MSTIKTHIAQVIKIFGIMAIVAAFAAAAFPSRTFANDEVETGKLVVSVYRTAAGSPDGQPVGSAGVEIINASGTTVAKVNTDKAGMVGLGLAKGVYKVRVSAQGYKSVSAQVTVNANSTSEISIELVPNTYASPARGR